MTLYINEQRFSTFPVNGIVLLKIQCIMITAYNPATV